MPRAGITNPAPRLRFIAMLFRRRTTPVTPIAPTAKRVRELEVVTARLIRAGFAGDYHAAFHGRGLEFSQVREYQPGDDIRTIDWNVTARSGVPHVKQFVEERDLTVLAVVDVSNSMRFGSVDRRKIDLASELVAVLAFAAQENSDRIGVLLFSDRIVRYVPPRRGRLHVEGVVRAALSAGEECRGTANFGKAADYLQRVLTKRSVLLVISDFLDALFERPLRLLGERHDLIAIALSDPREERFPDRGLVRLTDAETGEQIETDLRGNFVRHRAEQRQRLMQEGLRKAGIDALALSTAVPYDRTLLRFFERRIARMT